MTELLSMIGLELPVCDLDDDAPQVRILDVDLAPPGFFANFQSQVDWHLVGKPTAGRTFVRPVLEFLETPDALALLHQADREAVAQIAVLAAELEGNELFAQATELGRQVEQVEAAVIAARTAAEEATQRADEEMARSQKGMSPEVDLLDNQARAQEIKAANLDRRLVKLRRLHQEAVALAESDKACRLADLHEKLLSQAVAEDEDLSASPPPELASWLLNVCLAKRRRERLEREAHNHKMTRLAAMLDERHTVPTEAELNARKVPAYAALMATAADPADTAIFLGSGKTIRDFALPKPPAPKAEKPWGETIKEAPVPAEATVGGIAQNGKDTESGHTAEAEPAVAVEAATT